MTDLKTVYKAIDEKTALENLNKIEKKWGKNYGYVFKSWKDNWAELSTMSSYPNEIRRIMYTTNAIE